MLKLILAVCLLLARSVNAAPYRPALDSEVLETVTSVTPKWTVENTGIEPALETNRPPAALLQAVRASIAMGRSEGDPRHFGRAEALLLPLQQRYGSDPEVLMLLATVLQNRHDFEPALRLVDKALTSSPRFGAAWLLRAAILEVQGDYAQALRCCLVLSKLSLNLSAAVCTYSNLSLSGQANPAYAGLKKAIATARGNAEERHWALLTLAEMAERLGKRDEAEQWFQAAFTAGPRSAYLLATYADFLLDGKRYNDVIQLLLADTRSDPLLLRLTLAEQALNHPNFADHAAEFSARLQAADERGDATHQGDASRFNLAIRGNGNEALRLALANWTVQREPRDARLVLEAGLSLRRRDVVAPVIHFLQSHRLEDKRLEQLLRSNDWH